MTQTVQAHHPRPSLAREGCCLPLDGEWEFRRDWEDRGLAESWYTDRAGPWDGRIRVPFAWETAASGVESHWMPVGWYRRVIEVPLDWSHGRTFLIVGGVHHEATVWASGIEVGRVVGGHAGLECELTAALSAGTCTVVVRVVNPVDKRFIPHGKQRSIPPDDFDGCQFTPSSGIWQSVWLEARPETFIRSLSLQPTSDLSAFSAVVNTGGATTDGRLEIQVGSEPVVTAPVVRGRAEVTLPIAAPRLWSPRDPYLYDITATLHAEGGGPGKEDVVTSFSGLRRIEARGRDLYLNGERIYLRGVLDQGYWPDTGLTAPSPDALRRDLELARDAGFNFVRKHLKFEDPRQLHLADQLGMLMWVEPPSIGRYRPDSVQAFEDHIVEMIHRYGNHPSIIIWGLYNEEWGLDWRAAEDAERADVLRRAWSVAHQHDESRLIVDNSGWCHVDTDIVDWHVYTADLEKWDDVVSGIATGTQDVLPIGLGPNHDLDRPLWAVKSDRPDAPVLNTEYGVGMTSVERGWHLRWQTQRLRREDSICGYIYCELTDIEHEMAGAYTFHRRPKDLGGTEPSDVHADTVLIPDLIPIRPGADLKAAAGEDLTLNVFVSHHGTRPFVGALHWSWDHYDDGAGSIAVTVNAYIRSDPFTIKTVVPPALPGAAPPRLRLVARNADGSTSAQTFVDIAGI